MKKGLTVVVRERADIWRPVTAEETEAWYASPESRGMNCAGESKLPPMSVYRRDTSGTFTVTRARVNAPRGWGSTPKCSEIKDSDGALWYCHRSDLHSLTPTTPTVSKMAPKTEIDAEIVAFMEELTVMRDEYDRKSLDNLVRAAEEAGHSHYTVFGITWGRKYAKITSMSYEETFGHTFCFVNRSNGDVLKSNGSGPAKHARGNVLRADRLSSCGPYGAVYLR